LIPRLLKAKVSFVDLFSRLNASDLADGVHPADGYRKITDGWYDPILNAGGDKGTLRNIENIVGSAFDDVLRGNAGVNVIEGGAGMISLRVAAVRIPSSIEPRVKVETRSLTLV